MRLKQKLKTFFKAETSSESAVELLRMFIIPFMKKWNPRASVDDALAAFFSLDDRKIVEAVAKRAFKMPGQYLLAGASGTYKHPYKEIKKGETMLIVVDRKDGTAKIDVIIDGKTRTFKLKRFEFESLKDWVDITDAKSVSTRHRDNRT